MDQRFVELLTSTLRLDRPITEDAPLLDLGLDSMLVVELLAGIEEAYGVSLPDEDITETTFATPGSLWAAVHSAAAPAE